MPSSFIIEIGLENEEHHKFIQRIQEISQGNFVNELLPEKHCRHNMWIVKPANQNQGRGIEVCTGLGQIRNFLSVKPLHSQWVVQKYIEKPMLYKNRKFDLRVWALVTETGEVMH